MHGRSPLRAPRHSPHRLERGAAAVELVFIAPVLVAFLGSFVAGGSLLLERERVDDAARTAVEAAVLAASPSSATAAASEAASAALSGPGGSCQPARVATDVADFVPGGSASVAVTCTVRLPYLSFLPGIGPVRLSARASAVLDPYRSIGP